MLMLFIDWILQSEKSKRAVVHCSAGIGRTGTTIALANMMIKLAAQRNMGVDDPLVSVFHTVRQLREHRYMAV